MVTLTGDPNVGVSLGGVVGQQLGFGVAAVVALLILRRVWVPFFQTMLRYAFASRLPVVIVMLVTMIGGWGDRANARQRIAVYPQVPLPDPLGRLCHGEARIHIPQGQQVLTFGGATLSSSLCGKDRK